MKFTNAALSLLSLGLAAMPSTMAAFTEYEACTTVAEKGTMPLPTEHESLGRMSAKDCVTKSQKEVKAKKWDVPMAVGFTQIDSTQVQCYLFNGVTKDGKSNYVDHTVGTTFKAGVYGRGSCKTECYGEIKKQMDAMGGFSVPPGVSSCGSYASAAPELEITWYKLPKLPDDPTPSSGGDPHFTTWGGKKYDFHGGCDLVMISNPQFANGLGMNVHIRTSIKTWWSFIETAVVQIGASTLQVSGGAGVASFNGASTTNIEKGDAFLGDFPVHFRRINDHQTSTRIDLGSVGKGDAISIETYKSFVRVNIANKSNKSFVGSNGMLGAFPRGELMGRDGNTVFEDVNEYGQEWMVRASDGFLFSDVHEESPSCAMPTDQAKMDGRRKLGESTITEEQAAIACARVSEAERDACIFDVMVTLDLDMAGSY